MLGKHWRWKRLQRLERRMVLGLVVGVEADGRRSMQRGSQDSLPGDGSWN